MSQRRCHYPSSRRNWAALCGGHAFGVTEFKNSKRCVR